MVKSREKNFGGNLSTFIMFIRENDFELSEKQGSLPCLVKM